MIFQLCKWPFWYKLLRVERRFFKFTQIQFILILSSFVHPWLFLGFQCLVWVLIVLSRYRDISVNSVSSFVQCWNCQKLSDLATLNRQQKLTQLLKKIQKTSILTIAIPRSCLEEITTPLIKLLCFITRDQSPHQWIFYTEV